MGQHWVTDIFLLLAPGGEEMCLDKKHEEGLEGPVFGVPLFYLVQTMYSNKTLVLFIYLFVMDQTAAFPVVWVSNKK